MDIIDNNLNISINKNFLNQYQSDWLFNYCLDNIKWGRYKYFIHGKEFLSPRLTFLYGSYNYTYAGQTLYPNPFTCALKKLNTIVSEKSDNDFNVILFNLYRDGQDSMGWHSDDEVELGKNPVIASLSLCGSNPFKFRENNNYRNQYKVIL